MQEHGLRARARLRRAGARARRRCQAKAQRWPRSWAARRSRSNAEVAERADVARALPQAQAARRGGRARSAARAKAVVSILAATPTERARARLSRRAGLPLHPEHPGRGPPAACSATSPGSRAADGPEQRDPRAVRPRRAGDRARREPLIEPAMALMSCGPAFMALVAESFADAGGGARPRARRRQAHGRRDDGRHRRLPARARLRHAGAAARAWPRRAARPSAGLIALEEHGLRDAFARRRRRGVEATPMSACICRASRAATSPTTSTRCARLPGPDLHPDPHSAGSRGCPTTAGSTRCSSSSAT